VLESLYGRGSIPKPILIIANAFLPKSDDSRSNHPILFDTEYGTERLTMPAPTDWRSLPENAVLVY
jgi:hypothetical protein